MSSTPYKGCKYVHAVPRKLVPNLEYRRWLMLRCAGDREAQREAWIACSRDPLFWINSFVWTYDPRKVAEGLGESPVIPFISWEYQDETLCEMRDALGVRDMCIAKSRDMGASWMVLAILVWQWLFRPMRTFLLVSRVEDLVDKKDEPDCLMWKVDFILKHLPSWMKPEFRRASLVLKNETNGSTITGASTTGETSRGGRKTAIVFDEFAMVPDGEAMMSASRDNTRCRMFISTPKGVGNAFYAASKMQGIQQVRLHWSRHPEKSAGLYRTEAGRVKVIDSAYTFPHDYRFAVDGKYRLRSPWFDEQCKRAGSDQEIAQELEINFHGSGAPFFDGEVLDRVQTNDCRPVTVKGHLEYDQLKFQPRGFTESQDGSLRLWFSLVNGRPPPSIDAVLGVDVATGTGATNSVISIGNRLTGEKVAEFASRHIQPHELAAVAVSLARWFSGPRGSAFLIWESAGPGEIFGRTVMEHGFSNVFWRENERSTIRKVYDQAGWHPGKGEKVLLLGDYRRALGTGSYIQRCEDSINEARQYEYAMNGGVTHPGQRNILDASGTGDNHGDRVIADALTWRIMKDEVEQRHQQAQTKPNEANPYVPGTYGWQLRRHLQEKQRRQPWRANSRLTARAR